MKQTKNTSNNILQEQAYRYRLYLLGWAYIPYQDLHKYKNSYKLVYNV